jgi:hypothetical protein
MKARLLLPAVVAVALGVTGAVSAFGAGRSKTVHLRGTAYEFNVVHTMLAGATIRVAEYPKLKATVRADGRYDLAVPDHARVTPYIVAAGYHTVYLQTFTTDGEDLANVNFQTPSNDAYKGLVLLLGVPVNARGNLVKCAIVSTFNTRNVRDLSYRGFVGYGAHGVAGATATASPALPKPIYFNKDVRPDPKQLTSSVDGGVVWTGVPAGVYRITAHSSTTKFASFVATCRPGRVVNANPPWGLHELGLPNPARVAAAWSGHGASSTLSSLRLTKLPATQPIVTVRCTGTGCRFSTKAFRPRGSGRAFDVRRAIGKYRLRAGQALLVKVTAHRYNGVVWRWTFAGSRAPKRATLCVPLGNTLPRAHCR